MRVHEAEISNFSVNVPNLACIKCCICFVLPFFFSLQIFPLEISLATCSFLWLQFISNSKSRIRNSDIILSDIDKMNKSLLVTR